MAPKVSENKPVEKIPINKNNKNEALVAYEDFLRRLAYSNTTIKIDESFFDDSDMMSEYFLVIVYDKKTNTPLLSSRYYFDQSLIEKYLKGDDNQEFNEYNSEIVMDIKNYKKGEIFLADRLSGNVESSIYQLYRNYIFLLYYLEIYVHNKDCKFLLMARKEKYERLLTKYLRLGLNIVGTTKLRGKEHWILIGQLNKIYSQKKASILSNALLLFKISFYKSK